MVVVRVETVVRCVPSRLFDLALDVGVHTASLAGSGETATTSTGDPVLRLGDEVTFRARHLGAVWSMTARVTEHDRPGRFVDEQVRGPFATMRHEHLFTDLGEGRTRMTDVMEVRAPLGPLGRLAERVLLGRYLERLLRQRAAHLRAVAQA